jgi:hypothetical protein
VLLGLEEGWWKVERTSELQPVATVGAAGGSVLRPGECEGGGGAWRSQGAPRLGPPVASCCACSAGRARARRVYAGAARLPWRDHLACPEVQGHLARCGGGRQHASRAHGVGVRPKLRWPGWNAKARRRRDVAARARRRI